MMTQASLQVCSSKMFSSLLTLSTYRVSRHSSQPASFQDPALEDVTCLPPGFPQNMFEGVFDEVRQF